MAPACAGSADLHHIVDKVLRHGAALPAGLFRGDFDLIQPVAAGRHGDLPAIGGGVAEVLIGGGDLPVAADGDGGVERAPPHVPGRVWAPASAHW